MTTALQSKQILIEFVQGNRKSLAFKGDQIVRLESDYRSGPSLFNQTIEVLSHLFSKLSVGEVLSTEEKIAFNQRVVKIQGESPSRNNQLAPLKKLFILSLGEHDLLGALEKGEIDLVYSALSNRYYTPFFYTKFNAVLFKWINSKEKLTVAEAQFACKALPFVEDRGKYLQVLNRVLPSNPFSLPLLDLWRLQRSAIESHQNGIVQAIHKSAIVLSVDENNSWKEALQKFNRYFNNPLLLETADALDLLATFEELLEAKNDKVFSLLQAHFIDFQKRKILSMLIIEMHLKKGEAVGRLIYEMGPPFILDMFFQNPSLRKLLTATNFPLLRVLLQVPNLSDELFISACTLLDTAQDALLLDQCLLHRQHKIAKRMVAENAGLLGQIRSIFRFDPPVDWIQDLIESKAIISLSLQDIEMLISYCSPQLIDLAVATFPHLLTTTDRIEGVLEKYLKNPFAIGRLLKTLFPKQIEQINRQLESAQSLFKYQEEDPILSWLSEACEKNSELFIALTEVFPVLFQIANKIHLLHLSLKNPKSSQEHLYMLLQEGPAIPSHLFYKLLLHPSYKKGELKRMIKIAPYLLEVLRSDIRRRTAFPLYASFKLSEETILALFEDLFEECIEQDPLNLLFAMVTLLNSLPEGGTVDLFLRSVAKKKFHPLFRSFFYLSERNHPLCTIRTTHLAHMKKESLRYLIEMGSYKDIFGSDSSFMHRLILAQRIDLFVEYLHLDDSLFRRNSWLVTGSFLYNALMQTVRVKNCFISKGEFFAVLGLGGVIEALKLGVDIHLNDKIKNPLISFARKGALNDDVFHFYSKEDSKPLLKYLEKPDQSQCTPLLVAAREGRFRLVMQYLLLGADLNKTTNNGENLFDLLFCRRSNNPGRVLDFLYFNRIPCAHLLFEKRYGQSPFELALKQMQESIYPSLFRLISRNLPPQGTLFALLDSIIDCRPNYLCQFLNLLTPEHFSSLSSEEWIFLYERALNDIGTYLPREGNTVDRAQLKAELTSTLLQHLDPNLQGSRSLLEIAMSHGGLLIKIFLDAPSFSIDSHRETLLRISVNQLLNIAFKMPHPLLTCMIDEKLAPQLDFVQDFINAGYLTPHHKELVRTLSFREANRIGEDLVSLVAYFFQIDPSLYSLPVLVCNLPQKEKTDDYPRLLTLFDEIVPSDYKLPDDNGILLNKSTLRQRLQGLIRCISKREHFAGVPRDIEGFYKEIENKISHLLGWVDERKDGELTLQVVTFLARGGPGGHCGTRWDDELDRFCNFLGPQVKPQNLSEWLLVEMNQFRVGCFYKTAACFPHKWGYDYEPHVRNLLRFYIQGPRNIQMGGKSYNDPHGGSFKQVEALQRFDQFHTIGTLFTHLVDLFNGPLPLMTKEWIQWGIKGLSPRFSVPPSLAKLYQQEESIASEIEALLKDKKYHPFVAKIKWKEVFAKYSSKKPLLNALKEDEEVVFSALCQCNPDFKQFNQRLHSATEEVSKLKVMLAKASSDEQSSIKSALQGALAKVGSLSKERRWIHFFKDFLRDLGDKKPLIEAILHQKTKHLDQLFQHYVNEQLAIVAIQGILQKVDLSVEDYSRLLNRSINPKEFVHLAIVSKHQEMLLDSFYQKNRKGDLLIVDGQPRFKESVPVLLALELGLFKAHHP